MKRLLLVAAILLASSSAEAITLTVTSSRTSCTAPCAVFFDVIASTGMSGTTTELLNGDYVMAHVDWNFSDYAGIRNTAIGFNAMHVWELPGTYVVGVGIKDSSGATASTTVSITVSAMSGTTYYCSAAGSGSTCSFASPCDMTTCKTHVATGNTLLFKQGDSWTNVTKWQFSVTGPVLFGTYYQGSGSTAAPSLSFVSTETNPVQLDTATDVRFVGLHFIDTSNNGTTVTIGQVGTTTHTLVLRCDVDHNVTGVYASKFSDATFIVDSNIHDTSQYGIYAAAPTRMAIVGNIIKDYGIYHGTRIQGCKENGTPGTCSDGSNKANKQIFSYNVVSNSGTPFDNVQYRGDNANIVMVGNQFDNNVGIQPQNDSSLEIEQLVLLEGNFYYGPVAGTNSRGWINLQGRHIVARNNVCSGAIACFTVSSTGLTPVGQVDEIYIYNNTAYYPQATNGSSNYDHPRLCDNQAAGTTITVCKNNIMFNAAGSSPYGASAVAAGTWSGEDYNLWYAPNGANITTPSGAHDVNANPGFLTTPVTAAAHVAIGASSPARDAGTSLPVWCDFGGATRPNSLWDMGAFEYVSTSVPGKGALSSFGGF